MVFYVMLGATYEQRLINRWSGFFGLVLHGQVVDDDHYNYVLKCFAKGHLYSFCYI